MTRKMPVEWAKLDNAAKIFPPATTERDTKVFRFVCELKEEIDKDILQKALDATLELFPIYKSVLRRGVFWYYFEDTELKPVVSEDHKLPCNMIYHQNRRNLLFEVSYYKCRINVEMYHALADGTGAMQFLKTLAYHYIIMKYETDFDGLIPDFDYDASFTQKNDDSFLKHYSGDKSIVNVKLNKAYHINGRRYIDNRIKIIEGEMSVKEVLAIAHRYDTTMTIYLAALFMKAIYEDMPARARKTPVALAVPVNLRAYFPSVTARNFFTTINLSYHFGKNLDRLEDIIQSLKESFHRELTMDNMRKHIDRLSALEHNVFMRVVPLILKDYVLRIAHGISNRTITAALSNIGRVTVCKELTPYIRLFDCFTSANRPQICMCSFGDRLVISFTSPFIGTDIQKNFFRALTNEGVNLTIASNIKDI
jgi:NRPS condensation-like uncharacterized protein